MVSFGGVWEQYNNGGREGIKHVSLDRICEEQLVGFLRWRLEMLEL